MSILIRPADASDIESVLALLADSDLTASGLREDASLLLVAVNDRGVAACAAIESDGTEALLRSVAVASTGRGQGLGTRLVRRMEEEAQTMGVETLYLLTTTAEGFFERLGYVRIERDTVPAVVRASAEFNACESAGATAMCRRF